MNVPQGLDMCARQPLERRTRDDQLRSVIALAVEQVDERLDDEILLVLDRFTEKLAGQIDDRDTWIMTVLLVREREQSVVIRHQKIEGVGAAEHGSPSLVANPELCVTTRQSELDGTMSPRVRPQTVQGVEIGVHAIFQLTGSGAEIASSHRFIDSILDRADLLIQLGNLCGDVGLQRQRCADALKLTLALACLAQGHIYL